MYIFVELYFRNTNECNMFSVYTAAGSALIFWQWLVLPMKRLMTEQTLIKNRAYLLIAFKTFVFRYDSKQICSCYKCLILSFEIIYFKEKS